MFFGKRANKRDIKRKLGRLLKSQRKSEPLFFVRDIENKKEDIKYFNNINRQIGECKRILNRKK